MVNSHHGILYGHAHNKSALPIVHNVKGTNENYSYSSIIRSLMYSMVGICFYGVFAIGVLNHFKSSKKHWEAKKMIVRYVNNRLRQGLSHGRSEIIKWLIISMVLFICSFPYNNLLLCAQFFWFFSIKWLKKPRFGIFTWIISFSVFWIKCRVCGLINDLDSLLNFLLCFESLI